jgi:SAM-dependent methyltransferase
MDGTLFEEMRAIETEHWWLVGRGQLLLALTEQECRKRASVERLVDVGSGTGALLAQLSGLADEAVGVEVDPIPLEMSRARGLDVREALADDLPFADETVDLLTAFDVLEHVPDDVAAAREFHRVLRPGGVAVISVPAYRWLWSGHDVVHGHFRRYTARSLRQTLTAAGLEVTQLGYLNALLLPLAVVERLFSRVTHRSAQSDLQPVFGPLNALFLRTLLAEQPKVLRGGFRAGLTVFATAERPL